MRTTAIYPGRYEWLEMMTQMRGPRSSKELILHHMILEDLLQWKWFSETWLCVCYYHRNVSPAPFCLLNHWWIYLQWLLVPSQCELQVSSWLVTNCIHSLLFDFLGALGKLCPFLSNCMTVLLKFPSTSRQKCVWIGRQTAKLLAILGMGFCSLVYNFLSTGSDT